MIKYERRKKIIVLFLIIFIVLIICFFGKRIVNKLNKDNSIIHENRTISQSNNRDVAKKQVEIITDYINIRKDKSVKSKIIGKVYKSEIYDVLEINDIWVKIKTSNNITGWIAAMYNNDYYLKYLDINGEISNDQKQLEKKYL